MSASRRDFLYGGFMAGAGALLLPAHLKGTEPSGGLGSYAAYLQRSGEGPALAIAAPEAPEKLAATEDNILGPFHRPGAPFRGKITPPLEPGEPLVIRGRVWGLDSKRPLARATIDVWQANAQGRYDNDDPKKPPAEGVFVNRARLHVDETGYYEYETIRPGAYQIGAKRWRPAHIHYMIAAPGYKTLVTQLYFKGDVHNATDDFIKESLIIEPRTVTVTGGKFQLGEFDIVLQKA